MAKTKAKESPLPMAKPNKSTGALTKQETTFKTRKSETVIIDKAELVKMQEDYTKKLNVYQLIDLMNEKLDACKDEEEIYYLRLGIEDMRSLLKNMLDKFDERLIEVMKDKDITEFESGPEGRRAVIYYGNEKKDELTDEGYNLLSGMVKQAEGKTALALKALSTSRSAFKKFAQVKIIAETLGFETKKFIKRTYFDKMAVQYVPKYIIDIKKLAAGAPND